jgi:hypothetical protein
VTARITVAERGAVRHVRVEGRLTGDEVGELEQVIAGDPSNVILELENLRSVDGAGLAALRQLRALKVEMRGVPPHLAWRIDDES